VRSCLAASRSASSFSTVMPLCPSPARPPLRSAMPRANPEPSNRSHLHVLKRESTLAQVAHLQLALFGQAVQLQLRLRVRQARS
jgi:hypothetical protein